MVPDRPQAVAHRRGHVRGPAAARHRRRAGHLHRRVRAVVAPRREVDHALAGARLAPAGGQHHPCRLGGDHGLEVDLVQEQRLEQLRLDQRRRHPDQRLVGEADRSLGDGVDVSREAEARGGSRGSSRRTGQGSAGSRAPPGRSAARGRARAWGRGRRPRANPGWAAVRRANSSKTAGSFIAPLQVAGRHGQLVEVDQQRRPRRGRAGPDRRGSGAGTGACVAHSSEGYAQLPAAGDALRLVP